MLLKNSISKVLLFILCVVPFISSPGHWDTYYLIKAFVLPVLTLLILFKWLLYEKNKRAQLQGISPIALLGVIYWALVAISMIFSVDRINSLTGFSNRWDGFIIITCYILLLLFASFYFELTENKIKLILISGTLMSLVGYLQFFGIIRNPEYNYPLGTAFSVAFGTLGNPNYMGSYLVIILTIAIYMYLAKQQPIYFITATFIYGSLLMSMTRGAWLGAILAIIILFGYYARNFRLYKSIITLMASFIIVTIAIDLLLNGIIILRFLSIFFDFAGFIGPDRDPAGGSFRTLLWTSILSGIPYNPLFGVGMSNLTYVIKNYSTSTFMSQNAHNEILHIAATTGIPSVIVYSFLLIGAVKLAVLNLKIRPMNILFIALICGYAGQSLFAASIVSFSFYLWISLGAMSYYNRESIITVFELFTLKKNKRAVLESQLELKNE